MYGYIYKTTDLETGAVYIGQHTNHYVRKYQKIDPRYFGSGKIIQKILAKYGPERLKCEILVWCESAEELNTQEIQYIKEYKSKELECYNIAEGGSAGFMTLYLTPEQRKKIKAKELQTKANKTDEEKTQLANRIRNTLLNKPPEEKAAIAKRHSCTWHNKPLSERQLREQHRLTTRESWTADQKAANSTACRKAKEKPVIVTNGTDILEFDSALICSRSFGWADCMAGMYIRMYDGVIKKRDSKYYGWNIYYKENFENNKKK